MKNYYTYLNLDELKSEFRDFKLKVLDGKINFEPSKNLSEDVIEKLNFIKSTFPDDVITGSLALKILGLLSRKNNDIDILIPDTNRYTGYVLDGYDDEFSSFNRLGFKQFKWKSGFFSKTKTFDVDFFQNERPNYLTFDFEGSTLKIHNPLEIMQYKLDIISSPKVTQSTARKHNEDLTQIFEKSIWQIVLNGEFDI